MRQEKRRDTPGMPSQEHQEDLTVSRPGLDTLRGVITETLNTLGGMVDSGIPAALDALEDASHTLEARDAADGVSQVIALQIRLGERKIKNTRESAMRVIALLRQAQKDRVRLTRSS